MNFSFAFRGCQVLQDTFNLLDLNPDVRRQKKREVEPVSFLLSTWEAEKKCIESITFFCPFVEPSLMVKG